MSTATRGFASLSPEQRRLIASMGGKRTHQMGKGHKWTSAEAAKAGRKGGRISRRGRKRVEQLV